VGATLKKAAIQNIIKYKDQALRKCIYIYLKRKYKIRRKRYKRYRGRVSERKKGREDAKSMTT